MKLFYLKLFGCVLQLSIAFPTYSSSFVEEDIILDSQYPAKMVTHSIVSADSSIIYGITYIANGQGPHPTVVLLHGLPGNEKNLDLAQDLRRNGYNVTYFNYRGSWGSQGVCSYANCIDDVSEVIDALINKADSLRVDKDHIYLVGHSMGAGIAIISGTEDSRVKGIVGISVWNLYRLAKEEGVKKEETLEDIRRYISTLGMLNNPGHSFAQDIVEYEDLERFNIEQRVAEEIHKPILIINEDQEGSYFGKYVVRDNISYEVWDTDHLFTNKRKALSRRIWQWLEKNTNQ